MQNKRLGMKYTVTSGPLLLWRTVICTTIHSMFRFSTKPGVKRAADDMCVKRAAADVCVTLTLHDLMLWKLCWRDRNTSINSYNTKACEAMGILGRSLPIHLIPAPRPHFAVRVGCHGVSPSSCHIDHGFALQCRH